MSDEDKKAIAELLQAYPKVVERVYEDGASNALKEVGALATDLVKAFRLVTAPIQYMGFLQDRLAHHLKKVSDSIPLDEQVTPPVSMLLPLLDKLKYQEDGESLTDLYIELLKRSCDKNRVAEAHPAFFNLIGQLCEDEAILLFQMKRIANDPGTYFISKDQNREDKILDHSSFSNIEQPENSKKHHVHTFNSPKLSRRLFPIAELMSKNFIDVYLSHIASLNLIELFNSPGLIEIHFSEEDARKHKSQKKRVVCYRLTSFGQLFANACIPDALDT